MANFDIKQFLQSSYKKEDYIHFIHDKFYGFEENDIGYEQELLNETDKKHIEKYKYLGNCNLDDDKELGFFEVITTDNIDIENNRVSLNNVLKKKASDELLDGAIAVFHNPTNPNVWRLSFIRFSYDENDKQQVTNLKRFTFVLGKNIPIKTAYQQLKKDSKYSRLNEIEEAFSVEKISKEFFTKYKELYHKLVKDITVANGKKNKSDEEQKQHDKSYEFMENEKDISFYIKKLLGRIVFLYFVQKKGWLNEDKKFLSNLFTQHTSKYQDCNFYDEILEDLFFEALNTKRENNKIKLGDDKYTIPYLNGGLFEADTYDKTDLAISNNDLKQVLELFDSYNFTVIEDTPHDSEIAIDPEMLGRVFEDLLEDRKDKGAFYTPREIVHYMCQQSIINYLSNIFNNIEDIKELVLKQNTNNNKFIKKNATNIYNALLEIKVLDPAIGSGAYPMGMLHEIVSVLSAINMTADIGQLKREVIENCIYGVDIEQSAVEIARLRFWLSIVVEEDEPTPLPNLSYKIMVGNSLLETINGFDPLEKSEKNRGNGARIKRMKDKFHSFYNASTNTEKTTIKRDIEKDVDDIFVVALKNYEKELNIITSKNDLFNTNAKLQKEHLIQVQNQALVKKIQEEYKKDKFTTELFLYKIYFSEVLDDGGFDVVIGNPPYVRQEKIKELKSKKEIQDFKSYCGTADLYIYFFEKGYKLLKTNGVLSYITSNKYTRAKYGKDFRRFVLENTSLKEYVDFNGVKVFESATVDTSILTYQRAKIKDNSFIYCDIDEKYKKGTELVKFVKNQGFIYYQNDLTIDNFNFMSREKITTKNRIEKNGICLKDFDIEIYRGIQTGNNNAFIINEEQKNKIVGEDSKSQEIIFPIITGKEIKKYSLQGKNKYLIYTTNETNIKEYSAIYQYLLSSKNSLDKKIEVKQNKMQWFALYRPAKRHISKFNDEKLLWNFVTENLTFSYNNTNLLLLNSSFMMVGSDLKYLSSILNSKVSNFYIEFVSSAPNIGAKAYVENLRIPKIDKKRQKPFETLVDYILFAKEQDMKNEASLFESIIDGMVYDLYFEEDMKKADCFITLRVQEIVKSWSKYDNDEFKKEFVQVIYDICKEDKTIQRGLIFSRNIEVVKIINGDKKDD